MESRSGDRKRSLEHSSDNSGKHPTKQPSWRGPVSTENQPQTLEAMLQQTLKNIEMKNSDKRLGKHSVYTASKGPENIGQSFQQQLNDHQPEALAGQSQQNLSFDNSKYQSKNLTAIERNLLTKKYEPSTIQSIKTNFSKSTSKPPDWTIEDYILYRNYENKRKGISKDGSQDQKVKQALLDNLRKDHPYGHWLDKQYHHLKREKKKENVENSRDTSAEKTLPGHSIESEDPLKQPLEHVQQNVSSLQKRSETAQQTIQSLQKQLEGVQRSPIQQPLTKHGEGSSSLQSSLEDPTCLNKPQSTYPNQLEQSHHSDDKILLDFLNGMSEKNLEVDEIFKTLPILEHETQLSQQPHQRDHEILDILADLQETNPETEQFFKTLPILEHET